MAKPNYEKPTSLVDLEERQKKDYVPPSQLSQGVDPQPSDTGYVGVDPIYQNYANDTEKPGRAEKGAEAKVEENFYSEDADFDAGKAEEGGTEGSSDDDETVTGSGAKVSANQPPPSSPGTPPDPNADDKNK